MTFTKGQIGFWKGKKFSKKHLENMSISHLGNSGYWLGKKRSPETIKKMSENTKGKHNSIKTEFKKGQNTGENNYNWKGGIKKHMSGYVWKLQKNHPFADKNGYVLEHRLVMEKHFGRFLEPQEEIHHINGIKNDNRMKNLKLFSNKSIHMKEEMTEERKKEMSISLLLKACSFFCKTWYRIKAVIIPEIEVAKARPLNFIGNIRAMLRTIFIIKEITDTFAGVSVSLRAKKQDCRILVVPYAVRPTL